MSVRRHVWLAIGLAVLAIVVGAALVQQQAVRAQVSEAPMQAMGVVTGTITAVDPHAQRLTLKVGSSSQEFTVAKDAAITSGREVRRLEELQPGEDVTVEFETLQNQRTVKTIKVQGIQPAPIEQATNPTTPGSPAIPSQ